jgi:type VI protein secretion system component Hcp
MLGPKVGRREGIGAVVDSDAFGANDGGSAASLGGSGTQRFDRDEENKMALIRTLARVGACGAILSAWLIGVAAGKQDRLIGGAQSKTGSSSLPGTIACSALEFSVSVRDAATGRPMGRASTSPIVCRKPADQVAVQLTEEAVTGRRIANITLNQNQVVIRLADAEVTNVQFKADNNGAQIVEATFAYQKAEIEHPASGTRVLLQ